MTLITRPILMTGRRVCLRDRLPTDVDAFLRWQIQGQWLDFIHYGMLRDEWEKTIPQSPYSPKLVD